MINVNPMLVMLGLYIVTTVNVHKWVVLTMEASSAAGERIWPMPFMLPSKVPRAETF